MVNLNMPNQKTNVRQKQFSFIQDLSNKAIKKAINIISNFVFTHSLNNSRK